MAAAAPAAAWEGVSFYQTYREFIAAPHAECGDGCNALTTLVHGYARRTIEGLQNEIDGRAWEEAGRPDEAGWGEHNRDNAGARDSFERAFIHLTQLDELAPSDTAWTNYLSLEDGLEEGDEVEYRAGAHLFSRMSLAAAKGNAFAQRFLSLETLGHSFETTTLYGLEDELIRGSRLEWDWRQAMQSGAEPEAALRLVCEE